MFYPFYISWRHFRRRWITWMATAIVVLVIAVYLLIISVTEGIRRFWMRELVGANADMILSVENDPYGIRDYQSLIKRLKALDFVCGAAPYCENPCLLIYNYKNIRTTHVPGVIRGIDLKEEVENGRMKDYIKKKDYTFKKYFPEDYWYRGPKPIITSNWIELPSAVKNSHIRALYRYISQPDYRDLVRFMNLTALLKVRLTAMPSWDRRIAFTMFSDQGLLEMTDDYLAIARVLYGNVLTEMDFSLIRSTLMMREIWDSPKQLSTDQRRLLLAISGLPPDPSADAPPPHEIMNALADKLYMAETLAAYAAVAGRSNPEFSAAELLPNQFAKTTSEQFSVYIAKLEKKFGDPFKNQAQAFFKNAPFHDEMARIPGDGLQRLVAVLGGLDEKEMAVKINQVAFGCIVGSTWRERFGAREGDSVMVVLGTEAVQSEKFVIQGFRRDMQARFGFSVNIDFRVAQRFFTGTLHRYEHNLSPDDIARAAAVRGISVWIKNLDFDETDTDKLQREIQQVFHDHVANSPAYDLANVGKPREFYYRNIQTKSWKEFDPEWYQSNNRQAQIFRFLIMFFLLLVGLFIFFINVVMVREKTRDIGLMRACGASRFGVAMIFLLEGAYIGAMGVVIGIPTGIWLTNQTIINGLETRFRAVTGIGLNPITGIMDQIPTFLRTMDVYYISILTLAITILAALIPAVIAARIDPVKTLHYE